MSEINRRGFLGSGLGWIGLAAEGELLAADAPASVAGASGADRVAPDVYFHEGSLAAGADAVCNNGWIILEDYVLVIDANYPAGARKVIREIRAVTDKPIRFACDTHHHADHSYGNQVFVENGAVPLAHTGVIEEMKRGETGYYEGKPGAWEQAATQRPDLKDTRLKPPSVLFPRELFFDDGKHRVELLHLGVAHTHGDAFAWLPKERVLFAGDACVNGPYNYMGDGDVAQWIQTLEAAKKLGAQIVCTGHGPRATGAVLEDQQAFFKALREQVGTRLGKKTPEEAKTLVEPLRATLKADPQIARFVAERGSAWDPFPSQVAKVYAELTGKPMAALARESDHARRAHACAHGLA
jgi:glyoxylase-like metal-dependent hydrolase (beta-lactamase superfamily II)